MEQYYRELALAPTATQEQIKSQYKQLVRLHHPDRFIEPKEKAAAEERLKAINEAYRILSSQAVEGQLVKFQQRELGLVVEPAILDFGSLSRRQRTTRTFQVHFEKEVEGVDFVASEENSWFRVSRVSHLYGTEFGSLEFEVEVDTTGLEHKTYQGWIDIYLDSTMSRMPLTLGVKTPGWSLRRHPRVATTLATIMLALFIGAGILAVTSTRSFMQPQPRTAAASSVAVQGVPRLLFTVQERSGPTIYATQLNNAQTLRYDVKGGQAAAVQNGQQIAYLDNTTDAGQLHFADLQTGKIIELTKDAAPKSYPVWSPDGRRLGYLVGVGKEARIGIYDFEQQKEYRLPGTVTAGVDHFAWSPDSKTLLFDLWQGEERRVYRMAWPDGTLEQLTNVDSWSAVWSPTGDEILVATVTGIERFDSAGRQRRQINTLLAERVSWSADGAWIAYTTIADPAQGAVADGSLSSATVPGEQQLWLMHQDGTSAQRIDSAVLWSTWSPTGATLGYITGNVAATEPLLYLWTVTPEAKPQLAAEVSEPFFSWLQ